MGHFQDSRFLGLSGRAIWTTIVVAGVVVGLFFIPETIKFALKTGGGSGKQKALTADVQRVTSKVSPSSERGALSPEALRAISSTVEATPTPSRSSSQVARKGSDIDEGERPSLFSGWNFKVKAGESQGGVSKVPSNLSLEKLGTKEFMSLLKQSSIDIKNFTKKKLSGNGAGEEVVLSFVDQLEMAARESAKGMPINELVAGLQELHVSTIQALSQSGADRGVILEWLKLPIVKFIDDKSGVNAAQKVRGYFVPRLMLKTVSVRQKRAAGWGADGRSPANLRLELGYKGSDIEKILVYANGRKISERRGAKGDKGYSTIKVNGDAQGVWTFVAYDKFGGRSYWKSYSFYPRVRRFRQTRNGEYQVAFRPESAPNSLDRFFLVGSSALRQNSDPMISVF